VPQNLSTQKMIQRTLDGCNRHLLLATKLKCLCVECHEVFRVLDRFPNGDLLLDCPKKHRRPLFLRRDEDVAAFETAKAEREARKRPIESAEWTASLRPYEAA